LDTCGDLIGFYSELNSEVADSAQEQIGFKSKIFNLKLRDPIYALDAHGDHGKHVLQITSYSDDDVLDGSTVYLRRSRGDITTETAVATIADDIYGSLAFIGVNSGGAWNAPAYISVAQVGAAGVGQNTVRMSIVANSTAVTLNGNDNSVSLAQALNLEEGTNGVGHPNAGTAIVIYRTVMGTLSTISGTADGRFVVVVNGTVGVIDFDTAGNILSSGTIANGAAKAFVYHSTAAKWIPLD
jgi:hypothetical protein